MRIWLPAANHGGLFHSMLSRDRCSHIAIGRICLAAIFIWLTSYTSTQPSPEGQRITELNQIKDGKDSGKSDEKSKPAKQTLPKPASEEKQAPTANAASSDDRSNYYAEGDLKAQQRMADAAEDLAWLTRWQLWLGGIGALLLIGTLVFTGISTRAATRAARAANDQVTVSRHALIHTQRAFVFLSKFEVYSFPDKPVLRIMPQWENSGETPTKNMLNHVSWQYFEDEMPGDFSFPDLGDQTPTPILIGPRSSVFSDNLDIDTQYVDLVKNGKGRLYVWGWAEYDDVFEGTTRHRTEFCNEVEVSGIAGPENQVGLRFRIHGKHNAADDQCLKRPKAYPR